MCKLLTKRRTPGSVEMDKKPTGILIAAAVLFVGGGLLLRFSIVLTYPRGESNWVPSPNQKHRAYVSRLTENGFFTGIRDFYEFKVEMELPDGATMIIYQKDYLGREIPAEIDMYDLEEVVKWTSDSYSVTFKTSGEDCKVIVPF